MECNLIEGIEGKSGEDKWSKPSMINFFVIGKVGKCESDGQVKSYNKLKVNLFFFCAA